MKSPRLNVQFLKAFNPAPEKPLRVKCDTGFFNSHYSEISITSQVEDDGRITILDKFLQVSYLHPHDLEQYPLPEKK